MTANISDKFFAARNGHPVWWGFTDHHELPLTASDAIERFDDIPVFDTNPTYALLHDGKRCTDCVDPMPDGYHATGSFEIVRNLKSHEPEFFGSVSDWYNIISVRDVAEACDKATAGSPIETIGIIGTGEDFFLSYELPSFKVAGQIEIKSFINVISPYKPGRGLKVVENNFVVVCSNTLHLALNTGIVQWTGTHSNAELNLDLEAWLNHIMEQAKSNVKLHEQFAGLLLDYKMQDGDFNYFLEESYPTPSEPVWSDMPQRAKLKAEQRFEIGTKLADEKRNTIAEWYTGHTTGITTEIRGTAWHTLMAATEVADYWKTKKDPATSILWGGRHDEKVRQVEVIAEIAGIKND